MFTGIVQSLGSVEKKSKRSGQIHFVFRFKGSGAKDSKVRRGQSVAVNGVCLTAAKVSNRGFEADVIAPTLKATTLGFLKSGDLVNVERSLCYGDELGGHFVTGHVDGQGQIKAIQKKGKNQLLSIKAPKSLQPFLAKKGSIALEGISLTVQEVKRQIFTVGIIPHTLKITNLRNKCVGDFVNLEIDLIARYLHAFNQILPLSAQSKWTAQKLKKQGF